MVRSDGFSGQRLRVARVFKGHTLDQLARLAGTSRSFLSRVEAGERQPSPLLVDAMAEHLDVLPDFLFGQAPVDEARDRECHFRNRQRVGAKVRGRVLAHATLYSTLVEYLDARLRLPRPHVPRVNVESTDDIERAAARCRMAWGLGLDLPLANVTKVAERAGIVIALLVDGVEKVDAFSRDGRQRPLAVLSWKDAASRNCFSLAHEVGHLVMHGDRETGDKQTESEADRFASALLMPRDGFMREFPRGRIDWPALVRLKARWRVSLGAMVRRAHQLGLLSPSQYTNAYKTLSYRGWRKLEPGEFDFHAPQMVAMAFAALAKGYGVRPDEVAADLGWRRETLDRVLGPAVHLPAAPAEEERPPAQVIQLRAVNRGRSD